MAAAVARELSSQDFNELSDRPFELEDERLCDQMSELDFSLNKRPNFLEEHSASSAMSPSNDGLYIDDNSDDDEPSSNIIRNMMTNEKRMAASFTNPPFFISSPQRTSSMDSSSDFFSESLMLRKRLEDIPEFLSEPPPHKRSRISERRRGRPRKEEISENEDLRTVAKRMYARAYRENMKSKFVEVEQQLNDLRKDHAILKASHKKLESLVEQCNFCSSSWALVKNMNINPMVLKMAYDTLTNIKTPTDSPRSSKTPSELNSRSPSIEC